MTKVSGAGARARLLTTVSAATLALLLAGTPAEAGGAGTDSYWVFELSGGVPFGDEQPWTQLASGGGDGIEIGRHGPPTAPTRYVGPDFTIGGTVGVVMPMTRLFSGAGPDWGVGVFARLNRSNRGAADATGGGYYYGSLFNILGGAFPTFYTFGQVKQQETHAIVDFEARRDVGLGLGEDVEFTAIIGLRFAVIDADTDTSFVFLPYPTGYTLNESRRSLFVGLGPRLGGALTVNLGDGFSFGADAAGTILLGHRSVKVDAVGGLFSTTDSSSRFDAIPMLEASASLNYDLGTSGATLSGGVKFMAAFGMNDQRAGFGLAGGPAPGERNGNRYMISPFVRLTVPIGGN